MRDAITRGERGRWLAAGLISALAIGIGGLGWLAESDTRDTRTAEAGTITVEDWSEQPSGRVGIPSGWEAQGRGGKCDLRIEELADGGVAQRVLHLVSDNDNCLISKRVGRIDVNEYPILRWRWKAVTLPTGGDSRRAATDDQAAQIYLAFPRFPAAVRSRIIGYVWDSTAPAGGVFKSASLGLVTYVIVRSGPGELGQWITETRNVREDFTRLYGEGPRELVEAVTIGIDSNDTKSRAESYVGEIQFRRP